MAEVTSIENLVHQESAAMFVRWNKKQPLGHSEQIFQNKHDSCGYIIEAELFQQLHVTLLFLFCKALPQQEIVSIICRIPIPSCITWFMICAI